MKNEFEGFEGLLEIMKRLRSPDGCPWDREQDMKTLKPYIIEEAYEVLEAIDDDNMVEIKEELGDLLLQVVFLSELASESNDFDINDVISGISEKLLRRHPHVFGDEKSDTAEEVVKNWASIKIDEKKAKGKKTVLDGVPAHMPALLRAHRLTEKASRVGFDWTHIDDIFKKLDEEIGEFEEAVATKDVSKMEDELGDVIFSLVNISRFLEINPEESLKKTIRKFVSRFSFIEESLDMKGIDIREANLDEMEKLWNDAKRAELNKA